MGFFNFWGRATEPDYETVLASLETSIKARESHLLSIRLRERRANALLMTYGLGLWIIYSTLWWFEIIFARKRQDQSLERWIGGIAVIAGPIAILCTRALSRLWFKRKQDQEEAQLKTLKKTQRDKVEELKKKTGYYSTRHLLEKYDDAISKKENRGRPQFPPSALPGGSARSKGKNTPVGTNGSPLGTPPTPTTPIRAHPLSGLGNPASSSVLSSGRNPSSTSPFVAHNNELPLLPPASSTPVKRTFVDKLADALLGVHSMESEMSPNSKYALICRQCFVHNGLVVKEEFDTIQYQCPRCGYFNARRQDLSMEGDATGNTSGVPHRRAQSLHVTRRAFTDMTDDNSLSTSAMESGRDEITGDEPGADEVNETGSSGFGAKSEHLVLEENERKNAKGQLRQRHKGATSGKDSHVVNDIDTMDTD